MLPLLETRDKVIDVLNRSKLNAELLLAVVEIVKANIQETMIRGLRMKTEELSSRLTEAESKIETYEKQDKVENTGTPNNQGSDNITNPEIL